MEKVSSGQAPLLLPASLSILVVLVAERSAILEWTFLSKGSMDGGEFFWRTLCLLLCLLSFRGEDGVEGLRERKALPYLVFGGAIFLLSTLVSGRVLWMMSTFSGYGMFLTGCLLPLFTERSFSLDTFPQCETLLENRYSVNLPITYRFDGSTRRGYINVVNPFRATLVLGTPGSGKSFSVYGHYMSQMIRKGYSLFVYDYKYPDLTIKALGELLDSYPHLSIKPKMYVVDFDSPLFSHRFNPMHPMYLKDPVDSTEMAEVIMKNVSRGDHNDSDFFSLSARCYIDLLIWFLKIYEGGRYCTFPHLIQLMGQNYKDVFRIMEGYGELDVKRNTFVDAIVDKAFEQLQGQIASARIPLNRFASKTLYWTLSGDDFTLDINDPEAPKIICIGNNPARQSIYGTTLALMGTQLFKTINVPGKSHCAVLLDELPTIYLKGLDNLINTARSNHVAVVLGAQDKSQLVRDYDYKESEVIFNTVGNLFAGAVKGRTAQDLSHSFGKSERDASKRGISSGGKALSRSSPLRDNLPPDRIEALSQGEFCGYVADSFEQPVHPKIFCGMIEPPPRPGSHVPIPPILDVEESDIDGLLERNYRKIQLDIADLMERELAKLEKESGEG